MSNDTNNDDFTNALRAIREVRAVAARVDLIPLLDSDESRAYREAVDLRDRHDAALRRVVDELLVALEVPVGARGACARGVADALVDHVHLDELSEAIEDYRDRAERRAIKGVIDAFERMVEQSEAVRPAARDWLVGALRAVAQMPDLTLEPDEVAVVDGFSRRVEMMLAERQTEVQPA